MLSNYLTDEMIVRMLIKQRCKIADQRAKKMQEVEFVGQTNLLSLNKEKEKLCKLFPPRSCWCRVGAKDEWVWTLFSGIRLCCILLIVKQRVESRKRFGF